MNMGIGILDGMHRLAIAFTQFPNPLDCMNTAAFRPVAYEPLAMQEAEAWEEIADDLEEAALAYRRLGMVDRLSVALADLGEVYAEWDSRRSEARSTCTGSSRRRSLYASWVT